MKICYESENYYRVACGHSTAAMADFVLAKVRDDRQQRCGLLYLHDAPIGAFQDAGEMPDLRHGFGAGL